MFNKIAQGFHGVLKEGKVKHGLRNFDSKIEVTYVFSKAKGGKVPKESVKKSGRTTSSNLINAQTSLNRKLKLLQKA